MVIVKIKKSLVVFMIALAVLAVPTSAFSYEADIVDISGKKYFPAVKEELSKAKESIFMVMFKVGLSGYDKSSSVYKLVDELVKAHQRGVKVKVILDQNIGFAGRSHIDEWAVEGKNAWCFRILKEAGIAVWYDDPIKYVHAKSIVIDAETVILGSANWTESAFFRNFEASVLIKSKELAKRLTERFEGIELDQKATSRAEKSLAPLALSGKFLTKPGLAGGMMTRHDERAFDLYLLLLREFDGNNEGEILLDYDATAKKLGIYDRMSRTAYRRQIIRSLRNLEKRYKLITFKPQHGKEAVVVLLDYEDSNETYTYPKKWRFQVPAVYWEYDWDGKLSMRAKFCYLINLAYASASDARPWWFASRETLAERFHVSKWLISKGMQELRSLNIIEVEYPPVNDGDYQNRLAKSYRVLSLYNPAWLESEWDRLELAYGADNLKQARRYAKIVSKENDSEVVEDIIVKTNEYGTVKVKKAFAIVAQKRIDNPKRQYNYVVGILRGIAEKAQ